MIKKFDVIVEKNDDFRELQNKYASDVLDLFNAIDWNTDRKECYQSEDVFGTYFNVSYTDSNKLEFDFDVELYLDTINKNENLPLKFSLYYSYQETKMEKVFFGLFGEKEKLINESIFMDDQDMEFTMKCLNAFLRQDHTFLMNNMYTNFGTDTGNNDYEK